MPTIVGIVLQLAALLILHYMPPQSGAFDVLLCFIFGVGNAAHMLAFSTAGDVVKPEDIGTSASIVSGMMFIVGGIMISRPGVRIGIGLAARLVPSLT